MARVYRAIQEGFDRPVALKIISPELSATKEFDRRFIREAKIVGRLSHAHIVPVYDVGEFNGVFYLAMELLSGGDLSDRMRATIEEKSAISIIAQLCHALGYAHQKGFIHRDVKPDNVIFRDKDTAVLTDFGIARTTEESADETSITQVRTIIGSPKYMSPEQSIGDKLDARTDIYSLGIMLYQMLTGEVPYGGRNVAEVSVQRFERKLPELPPTLRHLQGFIARLLAYEKDDRFSSCEEVLKAIDELPSDSNVDHSRAHTDPDVTIAIDNGDDAFSRPFVNGTRTARWRIGLLAVSLLGVAVLLALFGSPPWNFGISEPGSKIAEQDLVKTSNEPKAPATPIENAIRKSVQTISSTDLDTTVKTPTSVEFFTFIEAVNSTHLEDQERFVQDYPKNVLADIVRAKTSDDPELIQKLTVLADSDNMQAQFVLGELYDAGWGVKQDRSLALHFSAKAAKSGSPFSLYQLATLILDNAETDEQRREGIDSLENSAKKGFFLAQTVLANYYFEGKILGRDVDEGIRLLKLAGAQGDRNALFNLGRIYDGGTGLSAPSPTKARDYFTRAAKLGHADANNFLESP